MTYSPMPPETLPPAPQAAPQKNTIGLVALIFAGVGFLFAIIPGISAIAWLVIIPAIILAIIALVKKRKPTWFGLTAIIVAPISWLIAIIVTVAAIAGGVSQGISGGVENAPDVVASSPAEPEEPAAEPVPEGPVLGETITNNDGVAVTFAAVTCGIATAGPEFLAETAKGQFCEIKYSVQNGSDAKISLWSSDVTGEIGGVTYEANSTISSFGGEYFTTDLNPGLGTEAVVYIDIPLDKTLEYVVFVPQWSILTDEIRVRAS